MSHSTKFIILSSLLLALFSLSIDAATFVITNNCPYTVWAAAAPGGGQQLNQGQTWTINVNAEPNRGAFGHEQVRCLLIKWGKLPNRRLRRVAQLPGLWLPS
ncbi:hypothetical protein Nepgr_024556 [Nepenthes gracilis]|uniref:Thaumatin-like protein n=1 Tax=Nepenthes gracilis TaxID=150966 RepID=A0AAD3T326_NEPGR|nr:hypothetical protein Nepgr_024556 [Nepenthes gracilis]